MVLLRDTWDALAALSTATTPTEGTDGSEVLRTQPRDRYSTATSPATIELTRSPAGTVQGVFVGFVECSTSATINITAKVSSGGATKFTTGTVNFWAGTPVVSASRFDTGHYFHLESSAHTGVGYISVVITGLSSNNVIRVGRIMAGEIWQPTTNMSYGSGFVGWGDSTVREQYPSGVVFPDRSSPAPFTRFSLNSTSKTEIQSNAMELGRVEGGHKPVVYVRDPDDTNGRQQNTIYGLLSQRQIWLEDHFDHYTAQYEVQGMT